MTEQEGEQLAAAHQRWREAMDKRTWSLAMARRLASFTVPPTIPVFVLSFLFDGDGAVMTAFKAFCLFFAVVIDATFLGLLFTAWCRWRDCRRQLDALFGVTV